MKPRVIQNAAGRWAFGVLLRRHWRRGLVATLALVFASDGLALAASPAAAMQHPPIPHFAAAAASHCPAAEQAQAIKQGHLSQHGAACALHCGMSAALPSAEPLSLEQFFDKPPPTGGAARILTAATEDFLRPPIRLN